jgi:Fe-S cluster biogenesis protein NfuA
MALETTLQKKIQRIATVLEQLESTSDPNTRALAKELLESLMALHGAGLERILELASKSGEAGETIIRQCGRDELVSSLLLLYGLHPDDLRTRVTRALQKSRGYLESHGAKADLISLTEEGVISLRLHVKSNGCGSSAASVKSALQAAIEDAAPDAASILVEETVAGLAQAGFVPLAQLESGLTMAALSIARARGGD